ncbi:MAG: DUF2877 domain-containing protein [Deltaproteobacteria bacterium]|nr:DUF2877 domain-containing protein [Deltaproteobacteria bacterium]
MIGGSRSTARFDAELLTGARFRRGRVAAVFAHAALAECDDGDLLTLVHPSRELVPLGIVVPWDAVPAGGQPVVLDGRVLRLADAAVVLDGKGTVLRLPEKLWPPSRGALGEQLAALSLPARTRAMLGKVSGDDDTVVPTEIAVLREGLERLVGAFYRNREVEAAVRALVGLGPGSTPSGDDVVVGAGAAALRLRGFLGRGATDSLQAVLRLVPASSTTRVSRAMFGHAARGTFAEPLVRLATHLGAAEVDLTADALLLADLGAQTGSDMLAGAMAVAQACLARDA